MSCGAKNHGGGNSGDSGMSVCENGMNFHSGLKPIFFFPHQCIKKQALVQFLSPFLNFF